MNDSATQRMFGEYPKPHGLGRIHRVHDTPGENFVIPATASMANCATVTNMPMARSAPQPTRNTPSLADKPAAHETNIYLQIK